MYNTYKLQLDLLPCKQYPSGQCLKIHEFSSDVNLTCSIYDSDANPVVVHDNGRFSLTYLALESIGIFFSDFDIMGPKNIERKLSILASSSKGYFGTLAIV